MNQKSINVRLSQIEFDALYAVSQENLRHPRDQARYLLRQALLDNPETQNRNASTYQGERIAVSV